MKGIKSRARVRMFGEVFTPEIIVKRMVDLVGQPASWPETKVLEPACGNGNFLVELLARKLEQCSYDIEILRSVRSLYGVDILADNVAECRERLLAMIPERLKFQCRCIMEQNIVVGDFLKPETIWFLKGAEKVAGFDYAKAVKVDPYKLDIEWKAQAENAYKCMEAIADARGEYDRCKEEVELVIAEVDNEIRESSDKKLTEKLVESLVTRDERVRTAKAALLEAKHNLNLLEAARVGLENKREALANLVKLQAMGYYAQPDADIEALGLIQEKDIKNALKKVKVTKAKAKADVKEEQAKMPTKRTK